MLERKPLKITKVETVLSAYMVKVKVTVDGEPSTPPLYRPGHKNEGDMTDTSQHISGQICILKDFTL